MTVKRGLFLVLDGIDGAGKSTQAAMLAERLQRSGRAVVRCRDPGGTPAGDEIRRLLLDVKSSLGMECETLLYLASRSQLLAEIVRPALAAGKIVVCDRYELSTLSYQGHAGGIPVESIRAASKLATGGLQPDWTGVLDIDLDVARTRLAGSPDRIESRPATFHAAVREGFLRESALHPERITVLDASGDPAALHERIWNEVQGVLAAARRA
jgi:dTMP kinase